MEASILTSTKKMLGLGVDYTPFDLDILTHINSVFSTLDQLGVGPVGGLSIEDNRAEWSELDAPLAQINSIRSYVFLKVQMLFDPPATSFLIQAREKQIAEFEWRIREAREALDPLPSEGVA